MMKKEYFNVCVVIVVAAGCGKRCSNNKNDNTMKEEELNSTREMFSEMDSCPGETSR